MRRRLLSSTGLIALVAVLVLGVPLGAVGGRLLAQRVEQRLEREADAASVALERRLRSGRSIGAGDVARVAGAGHRLEVVVPGGRRAGAGAAVGAGPDPRARIRRARRDGARAARPSACRTPAACGWP